MSDQQDNHENREQNTDAATSNAQVEEQNRAAHRALLKAGWVAPIVLSVAANQAFAASDSRRR